MEKLATTATTGTTGTTATIETTKPDKSLSDIGRQAVWSVSEAALILRCDVTTVRRELRRGTITGVRIGNTWRIPASQFSALARAARSSDDGELKASRGESFLGNPHVRSLLAQSAMGASTTTAASATVAVGSVGAQHTLRIYLLGRPQMYIDDVRIVELERSDRRSQVIQLLALHRAGMGGMRLASSLNMAAHQYEDETLTPHYVRNLIWGVRGQARTRTGWSGIIQSPMKAGVGLHHYRLPDNTICDLWQFEDKLDEADRLLTRAAAPVQLASGDARGKAGKTEKVEIEARNGVLDRAAALREEALQLYRGEFCEGSNNGCIAQAARVLEERYMCAALQQGDYWRAKALDTRALSAEAHRWQLTRVAQASALGPGGRQISMLAHSTHPKVQTMWREAQRNYERVLKVDNYHDEGYIHAMECYAHLGNARGVDQMFTRCQDVLHADLMQTPGEDVVRTYQQCKALLNAGSVLD